MTKWESVDVEGTVKRMEVPGGWVYQTFDWVDAVWVNGSPAQQGHYRAVSSFFVPDHG